MTSFHFFAGKGGVGKTTCAAAFALRESARSPVLAVSTDPAHSLGDVFDVRLAGRPRRVAPGLDAVELDARRAFARWLTGNRRALCDAIERGTWLDRQDIDALLALPVPGVDELVGLLEITRLAAQVSRLVVVDTAPTGHTLRLLAAPDTVTAIAGVLDALQEEHRLIAQRFAGRVRADAADRLIELIANQAAETGAMLRDSRRTAFHWVTLPEALSLAEAEDGIAALTKAGQRVTDVVVNRLIPAGGPCPLCDRRRLEERRIVSAIRAGIGRSRRVRFVFAQPSEPRGITALRRIGRQRQTLPALAPLARTRVEPMRTHRRGEPAIDDGLFAPLRGAELLFVGGKGGVGKSTVAAAIATRLALERPDESVLLLSADPAHSLADVFDAPVGNAAGPVVNGPSNLAVRELDAAGALASKRDAFQQAMDQVQCSSGAPSIGAAPLFDLAPPGVDELFGMLSVLDARAAHRTVVVDTAPTGHALRLLEMPAAAREWVQLLLRVLLKYKALVRPGRLAAELVSASQSIRELQAVMRDRARTRFVAVTRAAAVPRVETERLLRRLAALRLATPVVIVNARTLRPGRCRRCHAADAAERRERAQLARFVRSAGRRRCAIIETPLIAPPPRGADVLLQWTRSWIGFTS